MRKEKQTMFTKNDTLEQILNTEPVKRAVCNLFPSCWLERIPPSHATHTMLQIEKEDTMEWGVPFISDAFVKCANMLMETEKNKRYVFIPLWNPRFDKQIPDSDLNNANSVWLFTGNPNIDNTAFAHSFESDSVPPYPSHAVSPERLENSENRPAAIICPGGGYEMLSSYSEGIQLAERMERDGGYKAFVLNYRITPNYYPLPQMDLALAIMHVRAHAAQYHIDPDKIITVGSSAGGHLCASEAYLHSSLKQKVLEELGRQTMNPDTLEKYQDCSARPDGIGLLYPVISFLSEYHEGSCLALIGQQEQLLETLSVEAHITHDYPPIYAFANEDDGCVPASNTKRLDEALRNANVPHLCELFPTGDHGVGLGYNCSCKTWSEQMLRFFEQILFD